MHVEAWACSCNHDAYCIEDRGTACIACTLDSGTVGWNTPDSDNPCEQCLDFVHFGGELLEETALCSYTARRDYISTQYFFAGNYNSDDMVHSQQLSLDNAYTIWPY